MLDPNLKTIQDYCYHQSNVLGHGTYAVVYRGHMLGSEVPVAIKVIPIQNMNPQTLRNLQHEVTILKQMPAHDNIIKVYAVYQTVNNVYVITEFCEGRLNNVRTEDYESVAMGIANGLKHLYQHNIIHRDLKTDNIMLKGCTPKIIDFGFARVLSHPEERLTEYLGTPLYMAPQIQQGSLYTSKCDIWSFGVLLYEMLFKKHPWFHQDRDRLLMAVRTQPLSFPFNSPSQLIMRIIERCLVYDEEARVGWLELFQLADSMRSVRRPLHAITDWQGNSMSNASSYNNMASQRQNVFSRSRERDNGRHKIASIEKKVPTRPMAITKPQTAVRSRINMQNSYKPRDVRQHYVNYYM